MRRFLVLTVCPFLLLFAGCGGGGEQAEKSGGGDGASYAGDVAEDTGEPPREAIPEAMPVATETEGVSIFPSFAADSALGTLAVSPDVPFDLYVLVEYPEPWHMMSLQYRLVLPAGVRIVGEQRFEARALTMGEPEQGVSMAFGCRDPGRYHIMKYVCVAEAGFTGGAIETAPGVMPSGETLLGFANCQVDRPTVVYAGGGSITLSRK
ncbi:MAG: hypothetical protein OEO21_10135 [Candidatus Krumholzibacteria bacterium]|nr:hypothetical protein [Candidatus Krumholzibacteria bacterium]